MWQTTEANITRSVHVMPSTHNTDLNSSIQLQMLWVEPGTFTMGSPTTEANRQPDRENQHSVKISKGFYLGKYEITQAQYEAVMTGNTDGLNAKPSQWSNNSNRPVEMVSWTDIQTFLTRLNSAEQASGNLPSGWSYVLPTESQWEYACRAGTSRHISGGMISTLLVPITIGPALITMAMIPNKQWMSVSLPPTHGAFLICMEMYGNGRMTGTRQYTQQATRWSTPRVLFQVQLEFSGGSWGPGGNFVRSSLRFPYPPNNKNFAIGFRVSLRWSRKSICPCEGLKSPWKWTGSKKF